MGLTGRKRSKRGSGDLVRAEILTAATDILVAAGDVTALSMREVAQRVDVSVPSIYRHFADKDALVDAVVSDYFASFDEQIDSLSAAAPTRLHFLEEIGRLYAEVALATPELYRIAFMSLGTTPNGTDRIMGTKAFAVSAEAVSSLIADGIYSPGDPTQVAIELWSAAHGVIALMIAKPYLPWGDRLQTARRVMLTACLGRMVLDELGQFPPGHQTDAALAWIRQHQSVHPRSL